MSDMTSDSSLPPHHSSLRNELRIFISSTFRDLQEEREHLVKKIFPEIRSLCRERGITFTEVDLRWGLTDEDVALGRIIRTCLEEVDRCRPYFIGITGHRYGYVPEYLEVQKDAELLRQFPWVEQASRNGMSITEMEALYALNAFPSPVGSMVNNDQSGDVLLPHGSAGASGIDGGDVPQATGSIAFYFRRHRASVDDATGDVNGERACLEDYQQRIRSTGAMVREFRDPGSLGELVYDHLIEIIKRDFAAIQPPTPLEKERSKHAAFSASRRHAYIANPHHLRQLDEWFHGAVAQQRNDRRMHAAKDEETTVIRADASEPLVIYAESGSGKSSLVAYWCEQLRRQQPQVFVVEHYIGIGAGDTDHLGLIRHVMSEIKERFAREEELPTTPAEIERGFGQWLGYASHELHLRNQRMVLALDGLNQLHGSALSLQWIPDVISPEIRLIVTSTIEDTLVALRKRGWRQLGMQPLREPEREAVVVRFLSEYHKALPPQSVRRIADDPKCAHALFLRTLLEELRLFGQHDRIGSHLDALLDCTGTEDLFQRVLERMEDDYSQRVVREVMSLLWASPTGLSEEELAELTGISRLKLTTLLLGLDYHLVRRDGLLTFFHEYLRRAVEKRYLAESSRRRGVHLGLVEYFERCATTARTSRELLHHLHSAGEVDRLVAALSTIPRFLALYGGDTQYDVLTYWTTLGEGIDIEAAYRDGFTRWAGGEGDDRLNALGAVARLLERLGRWEEAMRFQQERITIAVDDGDRSEEAGARRAYGWLLQLRGEYSAAFEELARARDLFAELGDHRGRAMAIGSMGVVYTGRGEYDMALDCFQQTVDICREHNDRSGLASAIGNMAGVYTSRGELDRGLEYMRQAQELYREIGNRHGYASAIGNIGVVHHTRGEFDTALDCLLQFEEICRALGDRGGLAAAVGGIGVVYLRRGEYGMAMDYLQRQAEICRDIGDRGGLASAVGNIGTIHYYQGAYNEALESLRVQEETSRDLGDRNGLSTALGNAGIVYRAERSFDMALDRLSRAAETHRAIGNRIALATWLNEIAGTLLDIVTDAAALGPAAAMPDYLQRYIPHGAALTSVGEVDAARTDGSWRHDVLRHARDVAEEARSISRELERGDITFNSHLHLARVCAAEGNRDLAHKQLTELLSAADASEGRADVHYWMWKLDLARHVDHRSSAASLYSQLRATMPKEEYRRRLEELLDKG